MSSITPFLWFDKQAEEAANLYVSLFPNSKVTNVSRYPEGRPGEAGSAMVVEFELDGQPFMALNGGPMYKFTEAVSFSISCEGQMDVDHYWTALSADGGQPGPCGWLKDKYGLSWQVVPTALPRLLGNPDREVSSRVMKAMMEMNKIEIADLEKAAAGEPVG